MEPTSSATATAASTSGSALALGAGSTYNNDHPIPSTASTSTSRNSAAAGDLWADILKSTNRQKGYGRKNLLVLCTYSHSRSPLLGGCNFVLPSQSGGAVVSIQSACACWIVVPLVRTDYQAKADRPAHSNLVRTDRIETKKIYSAD